MHALQYQPGQYVLVNKAYKKKQREKTKPVWTGPYIVKEIISNNVYEVELLLGKEKVYHAKHVFLQDVGELEVERIIEWRMDMGRHELYVKWLGFEENKNTWETADHLMKYIPEVVVEYADGTGNIALQEYLEKLKDKAQN